VSRRAEDRERFRLIVEMTGHAIVVSDLKRTVVYANPAAHALFGAAPGDLTGCSVDDLLPPESRGAVAQRHARATAGEPQEYETEVLGAGGARRIVSVRNAPLREGGAITGSVASLRDITEERRAQDERAESDARYRRLVETAADAIFTVDAEGRFTSVNRTMEVLMEKPKEQFLGRHYRESLLPPTVAVADQLFQEMLEGKRGRVELAYPMAGETRYGSVTTAPIIENGVVTGAVGVMRDVTEERRLTEQLMRSEKLAAIGQLVSGVAHELNNPLTGIMAFAQLLHAAGAETPEHRDAVETIHREAKRAARIVANLLLFARQRSPERTETDLNRVLRDTIELRRYVLRTMQVEVATEFDPALPRTWADASQLQQVALNLLTNAEHAVSKSGGRKRITVGTRRRGDLLEMYVADTGPGIAPEHAEQIFNPFFTTKPEGEGTGLGLSISDGIVREHGGSIRVESRPGQGASFIVSLPVSAAPAQPTAPAAEPLRAKGPPRRFLLVDDEPAIRAALAMHLRRAGHQVDAADSGHHAIALLGRQTYDAIFLDLRMPDVSGIELYARLRAGDPRHAARVVFATGDTEAEGAREFLRTAGRPFLAKPFLLGQVSEMLEQVARDV